MTTHQDHEDPTRFWERFYANRDRWSGKPNPALVDEVDALAPGTALDLGCGEGADAIWLAAKGWQVTAVDISAHAIERATEHAWDADLGDAIRWRRHDLSQTFPDGSFDLVSACYLQSPVELPRERVLRDAAAAVAPGGRLVIVAHSAAPTWAEAGKHPWMPTADETLASLELDDELWTLETKREITRPATSPTGEEGTRADIALRLRRD
ncbi:MAG: class I SAM-dependent methyltransferase [Patulibacter sp.]|nr:class I SAM-dependent methyltransferase [Patulibacter sp.]